MGEPNCVFNGLIYSVLTEGFAYSKILRVCPQDMRRQLSPPSSPAGHTLAVTHQDGALVLFPLLFQLPSPPTLRKVKTL